MFITLLFTVFSLMHFYVCWRVIDLPLVKQSVKQNLILWLFALLWLIFIAGTLYSHDGSGLLAPALEMFTMLWFGTVFIVSVPLLAVDILTGFGFWLVRFKDTLRSSAFILGLLLTLFAVLQGVRAPVIERFTVYLEDLPVELDSTTVAVISDTHIGSILGAEWLNDRVSQLLELKPDLIFILGDFLEGHGGEQPTNLLPILQRLNAPLGIWAVAGNHDHYGSHNQSLALLEKAGIKVLRNQSVQVQQGLNLLGMDYITRDEEAPADSETHTESAAAISQRDFIDEAIRSLPNGASIVLSHEPDRVQQAEKAGADLMLSGHTHGGQIWPFDYLVQRRYPYLEGRYELEKMTLIVTRGAGTWGPLMRLWQPGEILYITLRKKSGL